jgi:hypothetical protein
MISVDAAPIGSRACGTVARSPDDAVTSRQNPGRRRLPRWRAGLYLATFWALALASVFALLK